MLGTRYSSIASRPAVLLLSAILASLLALLAMPAAPAPASAQGNVKVEWLGRLFYRITSPEGLVIVTSPELLNPDGPVLLDELTNTNVILVPNSHNDDMGNPIEISAVSGARVFAPGPLGEWLVENGLDRRRFRRINIGSAGPRISDVHFRFGPSLHDNTLANGQHGGPAASFFMTFNNGFTIFYNGHSTLIADLAILAEAYQPDLAILGLNDALEFAYTARLMTTNNPRLRTVIPSHIEAGAATGGPDASILNDARVQMDRLGLGHLMFLPELRRVYEY